jgi:3-phenylpropionate/cinnamic acid dioxygenase small subunit
VKVSISVTNALEVVGSELQHSIEQFLYLEADLMDDWKLEEWVELLADDFYYFVPTRQNRLSRELSKEFSTERSVAYFREDRPRLLLRLAKLRTGMAWAETPPSRVRHLITNVRVRPREVPGEYEVDSSFYIFRSRMEREIDNFVGRRHDVLRRSDAAAQWQVVSRKVVLDVSTLPNKNISFFF